MLLFRVQLQSDKILVDLSLAGRIVLFQPGSDARRYCFQIVGYLNLESRPDMIFRKRITGLAGSGCRIQGKWFASQITEWSRLRKYVFCRGVAG